MMKQDLGTASTESSNLAALPKQAKSLNTISMDVPLLEVQNLVVAFESKHGSGIGQPMARAVDGISFSINQGQTLCLVGESGCGKSVSALALLGLLPSPPSRVLDGQAWFSVEEGRPRKNLLALSEKELKNIRGAQTGFVFQEPMTSLNPVLRIGEQVAETLLLHHGKGKIGSFRKKEIQEHVAEMLHKVGLKNPKQSMQDFPHNLSGGMRQRVMIAIAMICNPKLLIADEPTTALDVTLQGQILHLMKDLVASEQGSLLLITHDLDVVAECADVVAVMYSGKIVEYGSADKILKNPAHPYTCGLMASRPRLENASRKERLQAIPGIVPSPLNRPTGCAFSTRCPKCFKPCLESMPELKEIETKQEIGGKADSRNEHLCRCWAAFL